MNHQYETLEAQLVSTSRLSKLPCVAVIPAYNPDIQLLRVVNALVATGQFEQIVVVNDGSRSECVRFFEKLRAIESVTLLQHAVNLGKGAALKTALNYVCCQYPDAIGVVTADADGQHLPEDIVDVSCQLRDYPNHLVIGARSFQGEVPLRSWFGNTMTKLTFRMVVGCHLNDTQSGLRGLPLSFAKQLLRVNTAGYDFELDMLIQARKHGVAVHEWSITTVYEDGNRSSHFNPLRDSLMIYLVFLRFMISSVITALVGLTAFHIVYRLTANLLASEVALCIVGVTVNFVLCREVVFRSRRRVLPTLFKFLALVFAVSAISYFITWGLTETLPIGVITARIIAALVLYLANFAVQRDFIFQLHDASQPTLGDKITLDDGAAEPLVLEFKLTAPVELEKVIERIA